MPWRDWQKKFMELRSNKKNYLIIGGLFLLLIIVIYATLFAGSVKLFPGSVQRILLEWIRGQEPLDRNLYNLIIYVRLPRILLNVLAGAILSIVGILMQTMTGNPLAEPYVLGVSSGASTGAAGAIVFHWFSFFHDGRIFVSAFIGGTIAILIVLLLQGRSTSPVRLVLTGMGVSAFFQAATTFIVYLSENEAQSRSAQFWITGSFTGSDWPDVLLAAIALIVIGIFSMLIEKELNLLLLGRESAKQSGLNTRALHLVLILFSSFAVSIVVAQSGIIGFVGLIVPHMMRKTVGVRHRILIPASALAGGSFLAIADTAARTVFAPQELPIGVMTAFVGAPVFLFIIHRVYKEPRG